jgi:serine/threonine protein kinase
VECDTARSFRHPGIIRVRGEFYAGSTFGVITDHYPRGDLRGKQRPSTLQEAAALAMRLAAPVAHMHERGMAHLDIKPANYLIGEDQELILTDLEYARTANGDGSLAPLEAPTGTIAYMAPEVRESTYNLASDVFSLGATIHYALTGCRLDRSDFHWYDDDVTPTVLSDAVSAALDPRWTNRPSAAELVDVARNCLRVEKPTP